MSRWQACAKINLFLHVVKRLDCGYHELQTVYQLIDWCDELEFNGTSDGSIVRVVPIEGIAESDDLTVRAARLLRDRFPGPRGVNISVRKHVPVGAGLGGGSSCAATTLIALNSLWNLDLDVDTLAAIGAQIGADVPVFVRGRNAWAEGLGEILSDISLNEQLYLVVYPGVAVSTARVFREFNASGCRTKVSAEDFSLGALGNDLEAVTCRLYPEVQALIDWLRPHGAARMTGSGSSVFMSLESRQSGEALLARLPQGWVGRIALGQGSQAEC